MTILRAKRFVLSSIVLAMGLSPSLSSAQCAFPHPGTAKKFTMSLVHAFVPCNEGVCSWDLSRSGVCTSDAECQSEFYPDATCLFFAPNGYTLGGIPSCKPPMAFNESPAGSGWVWGSQSSGSVSFRPIPNKLVDPLNPSDNTGDIAVMATLRGIKDANGGLVDGYGTLVTTVRFTANGRTNENPLVGGDQTVVSAPIGFPVPIVKGKARLRTSYNTFLNGIGQPGLPGCTALELVQVELQDGNGRPFARPGVFIRSIK